jgi:hypothetical protein
LQREIRKAIDEFYIVEAISRNGRPIADCGLRDFGFRNADRGLGRVSDEARSAVALRPRNRRHSFKPRQRRLIVDASLRDEFHRVRRRKILSPLHNADLRGRIVLIAVLDYLASRQSSRSPE